MSKHIKFAGIDYGSKRAGTTVICFQENHKLQFISSVKKQDADAMILDWVKSWQPDQIFIDAPLSLPKAYLQQEENPDFFYRKCDRLVGAMSPLFLGGLTARAIQLKFWLNQQHIEVLETYPKLQAQSTGIPGYKKGIIYLKEQADFLKDLFNLEVEVEEVLNLHYLDAFLAYITGIRFNHNQHQSWGDPDEGCIII